MESGECGWKNAVSPERFGIGISGSVLSRVMKLLQRGSFPLPRLCSFLFTLFHDHLVLAPCLLVFRGTPSRQTLSVANDTQTSPPVIYTHCPQPSWGRRTFVSPFHRVCPTQFFLFSSAPKGKNVCGCSCHFYLRHGHQTKLTHHKICTRNPAGCKGIRVRYRWERGSIPRATLKQLRLWKMTFLLLIVRPKRGRFKILKRRKRENSPSSRCFSPLPSQNTFKNLWIWKSQSHGCGHVLVRILVLSRLAL